MDTTGDWRDVAFSDDPEWLRDAIKFTKPEIVPALKSLMQVAQDHCEFKGADSSHEDNGLDKEVMLQKPSTYKGLAAVVDTNMVKQELSSRLSHSTQNGSS